MILCPLCNCENADSAKDCLNCGEPMLHYNSLCGMLMLGDSSQGQVLGMRYIIEQQLSEDNMGCTYKAEDAADNTNVLIKALPLSVSLNSRKVEQLKETIEIITSLSNPNVNSLKAFEVSGKVRYFVYEYSEQQKCVAYEQTIEKLKTQLAQQKDRFALKLEEVEQKFEAETQARKQFEAKQDSYEDIIEQLKTQMSAEQQKHTKALHQANWNIEALFSALSQADKKIEVLTKEKEKTLQQNKENEEALEKIKAEAIHQQKKSAKQLDRAQWKIEALAAEMEKVLQRSRKKEEVGIKAKPAARFKISIIAFALTLVLGVICGIGTSYLYINSEKSDKNLLKQWMAVLSSAKHGDNKTAIDLPSSIIENNIATDDVEEKITGHKEQSKENSSDHKPLAYTQDQANEPQYATAVQKEAEQVDKISSSEFTKEAVKETQEETELQEPAKSAASHEQKEHPLSAEQLYLKAAEEGNSYAMYKLGDAYLKGIGTDKNIEKAIAWIEKAAEVGNDNAMFELGLIYYSGQEIERDYSKTLEYFVESAQAGNKMAMYNVGRMYHQGSGVEVDGIKAVEWYEKAAQKGTTKAMNQLAQMYYMGDIVKKDCKKAAEYYERSAKMGNLKAMYNLAVLYHTGVGVEKDIRKAMLWFIKAAKEGDTDSMYQLGVLFENGIGIENDLEKALYWYQTAARAGQKSAKQQLIKLGKAW